MDAKQEYARWSGMQLEDVALSQELATIAGDDDAINDRFWRDLEFGTGGLRGVIGAGANRMNVYTVRKATQGLADYLCASFAAPSVCIAYDTRNMSREFAQAAAGVFCANGIQTWLFDDVRPTPMLSFAVRHKGASAGIVLTASHNPKEYNGYKVYGSDGGQITDEAAATILNRIAACDVFTDAKTMPIEDALASGTLQIVGEDVDAPYYEKVKALVIRKDLVASRASDLKIIYSPLHGSGNVPVRRVLRELGFTNVAIVPEQERPDGNFSTTPYPNPEEPAVYALAIEMAKKTNPDLIFATDPDCDRIGVLVKNEVGELSVLTGNQVGALLCDYRIRTMKELGSLPDNAAVIKTIVTTDLAKSICGENGVALVNTLTGFKYIGEKIGEWENDHSHSFLFGFEESYGYLAGNFVRDKDAVIAAMLIAEMALYYREQGLSLFQAMDALYQRYGYTAEKLMSISMPGQEGQQQITEMIAGLRVNYKTLLAEENLAVFEDYKQSVRVNVATSAQESIVLPTSNVLKFIFEDGSWLVLRPSGTEPKIKIYLAAAGDSAEVVTRRMATLEKLGQRLTN